MYLRVGDVVFIGCGGGVDVHSTPTPTPSVSTCLLLTSNTSPITHTYLNIRIVYPPQKGQDPPRSKIQTHEAITQPPIEPTNHNVQSARISLLEPEFSI